MRLSTMQLMLLSLAVMATVVSCKTAQQWKSRNIYQLITDRFAVGTGSTPKCDLKAQPYYCGGNFKGIENNLDYIQNLGFNAIWISPVPDNYPDQYHGYATKNFTQINKHFGDEAGLKALVKAAHARDIWVMVDVVANHMGNTDEIYTQNVPFDLPEHYHSYCIISDQDFATKNTYDIEHCRLYGLADLDQDNSYVGNYLIQWIANLVKTYDLDGIRIDTVPQVKPAFWKKYTASAGVFATGEVSDGDMSYVGSFVSSVGSVLNYPWFYTIRDIFVNQKDMGQVGTYYRNWAAQNVDISILAPFIDNHDQPRFLSNEVFGTRDQATRIKLLKGFTTFTLTSIGVSIMYYGTEQLFNGGQDPYNREPLWFSMDQKSDMYSYVAKILKAKTLTAAGLESQVEAYCDTDLFAFYRGKMFVGVTSKFYKIQKTIITHAYVNGDVICNIFYPEDDCITIADNKFELYLLNGESKIFVPKALLLKASLASE